jgi:hypothetical protein
VYADRMSESTLASGFDADVFAVTAIQIVLRRVHTIFDRRWQKPIPFLPFSNITRDPESRVFENSRCEERPNSRGYIPGETSVTCPREITVCGIAPTRSRRDGLASHRPLPLNPLSDCPSSPKTYVCACQIAGAWVCPKADMSSDIEIGTRPSADL